MPYCWIEPDKPAMRHRLHLCPNRALPARGFVTAITIAAAFMALPLLSLIGKAAMWIVLAFLLPVLGGFWFALRRNQKDLGLREELVLWDDQLELTRFEVDGSSRSFEANPYWLVIELRADGGRVEDYLTLRGSSRTVELGAFLAPEERRALAEELRERLAQLSRP